MIHLLQQRPRRLSTGVNTTNCVDARGYILLTACKDTSVQSPSTQELLEI